MSCTAICCKTMSGHDEIVFLGRTTGEVNAIDLKKFEPDPAGNRI